MRRLAPRLSSSRRSRRLAALEPRWSGTSPMRRLAPPLARFLSSSRSARRLAALELLGCDASSGRDDVRDAFYELAKKHHPDRNPDGLEYFKKLVAAFEDARSGADAAAAAAEDDEFEMTGAAADPLAVFLRVEAERAAELRRELTAANALSAGGLDKGGMWELARQVAETLPPGDDAEAPRALPAGRRRRRRRR